MEGAVLALRSKGAHGWDQTVVKAATGASVDSWRVNPVETIPKVYRPACGREPGKEFRHA
jgi:hypothetical protein